MTVPLMREKILDQASRLFASQGYEAVSMRRLATETGMTQANLYHYFKDKKDLILSTLAHVFRGKHQEFERIIHEETDPQRSLERSMAWFATLLFEDAVFAKLLCRELLAGDSKRLEFLTKNVFQESFDTLVSLVEQTLETPDPVLGAIFLTSTVLGYFQFSGIIPHLRGARDEYIDPKRITQHLMQEIRKSQKGPGRGEHSCLSEA